MMILKFRSTEEHDEILRKIKKMRKFTEELEDCLEEGMEEPERTSYRREYDRDEERRSRYDYPRR